MPARGFVKIFPCCLCPAVRFLGVLAALFPWTTLLQAQSSYAGSSYKGSAYSGSSNDFQSTLQRAGLIFDGTVTAVQCELGKGKLPQTYRISFQVRQAVRGAATGSTYTIREWAGLWAASRTPRYRIGERALFFLYSPSNAGLTSTVGGKSGKLSIVANGIHETQVLLPPEWLHSFGQPSTASLQNTGNTPGAQSASSPNAEGPITDVPIIHAPSTQVPEAWLLQRIAQLELAPAGGH